MLRPNAGPYASAPEGKILRSIFLGYRKGLYPLRSGKPEGIILHTTGSGPYERWLKNPAIRTPWEAAREIYEELSSHAPHFVVCGETGLIVQGIPVKYAAWHVGGSGVWRYRFRGWDKEVAWWRKRWPELDSPRDLLGGRLWAGKPANDLCIGIDVSPPLDGPRAPWTQRCWSSLQFLVRLMVKEHQIPFTDTHIITHSDAHPRARSKFNRPWDPGPIQWPGRTALNILEPMRIV